MRRIVVGSLLLLALMTPPAGAQEVRDSSRTKSQIEQAILKARDHVMPALVFVKPVQEVYDWGQKAKRQIFGSGVIFTPDGYVLTNNHVAEKSTSIVCILADRREMPAEVVGRDPETDLAVLRLLPEEAIDFFPFARLGDSSKIQIGDFVLALGSPYGFERSLSFGVVSSTDRYLEGTPYNLWIQTDAAINPGNSGGPLVNASGEVVGINSLGIRGADNIGFAIPLHEVRAVIADLWKRGKIERAWTGVTLQALKDFRRSQTIEEKEGVLISHVMPDSPAATAGLLAGDVLKRIDDRPVNGIYDRNLPAIRRQFARLEKGTPHAFHVKRDGKIVTIPVTPVGKGKQEGEEYEAKIWGMTVKEIVRHENPAIAFFRKQGVYVLGAQWGGKARQAGLAERDIIVKVGETEIKTMEDFKTAFEKLGKLGRGDRRVIVRVLKSGIPALVFIEFERDAEAEEKAEEEEKK